MSAEKESKKADSEELKEVLSVVSKEVPGLIKALIGSVFSEEAGKDIGKAAAAFYRELKGAGMPEETAVKMTENYMSAFTSLSNIMKMKGAIGEDRKGAGDEIGEEISRKIREKLAEKHHKEDEE